MKKNRLLGLGFILLILASIAPPAAFGLMVLSLAPVCVPPFQQPGIQSCVGDNGTVTVTFCTTSTDREQYINITTPSGTIWKTFALHNGNYGGYEVAPPKCPTNISLFFGGGSLPSGATPPTNPPTDPTNCLPGTSSLTSGNYLWCRISGSGTTQTGEEGIYKVYVRYKPTQSTPLQFFVQQFFSVPEFVTSTATVSAVGMLMIALLARLRLSVKRPE